MIDTIHIHQHGISRERLEIIRDTWDGGQIENMSYRIFNDKINIKGSLSKLIKGNNIEDMKRCEVDQAIEKLSDCTGLMIKDFKLSRLDIGKVFKMDYAPSVYFPYLIEAPRMTKNYADGKKDGIIFANKSRKLYFYDKHSESKGISSRFMDGQNHLRFEHRASKIRQVYGRSLNVGDLRDEAFQDLNLAILKKKYNQIKKMEASTIKEEAKTPKDILMLSHIDLILKYQDIECMYDRFRKTKFKNRKAKYKAKKYLDSFVEKMKGMSTESTINELNEKINQVEWK